jgi:hypothetical protein
VPFNMIADSTGKVECWRQQPLAEWEIPRWDPAQSRTAAPELAVQQRAPQKAWRERHKRARGAAKFAAERDDAGDIGA